MLMISWFSGQQQLRGLLKGLQKDHECNGQILGFGPNCHTELKFLGRTIRLTKDGLEWEGDRKHAKAFVEKMSEIFAERVIQTTAHNIALRDCIIPLRIPAEMLTLDLERNDGGPPTMELSHARICKTMSRP